MADQDATALKYGLDDKLPKPPLLLYGLQWWVVSLPCSVVLGVVAANIFHVGAAEQIAFMQKLLVTMGVVTVAQVFFGHRMPLVIGPASTLLIGMTSSVAAGTNAVFTAVIVGGIVVAVAGYSGLLSRLRFLFTARIVAVTLVLIALTLAPTMVRLMFTARDAPWATAFQGCLALLLPFVMLTLNDRLPGMAKSLTVFIGMVCGCLAYGLAFGFPGLGLQDGPVDAVGGGLFITLDFDSGAIFSFLFCFFALTINELGSMESVGALLGADDMERRIRHGAGVTGLGNVLAGCLGVLGPVDYSLSVGVIPATGCASRYAMAPAGILLALCAVFPPVVELLAALPPPIMGSIMLYTMALQMGSGLSMLVRDREGWNFNSGAVVCLPLMLGLLVSFAPPAAFAAFPEWLRPIVANGFVMGILAVFVLEHILLRQKKS